MVPACVSGERHHALHRTGVTLGERTLRELQLEAPGRTAEWRNLLQLEEGKDRDRGLETALQKNVNQNSKEKR